MNLAEGQIEFFLILPLLSYSKEQSLAASLISTLHTENVESILILKESAHMTTSWVKSLTPHGAGVFSNFPSDTKACAFAKKCAIMTTSVRQCKVELCYAKISFLFQRVDQILSPSICQMRKGEQSMQG